MRLLGPSRSRPAGSSAIVLLLVSLAMSPLLSSASTSSEESPTGFHRIRQRAHRRRHYNKAPIDSLAQLLEMKAGEEEVAQPRTTKASTVKREKNEELCEGVRSSVELNTEEWEFDPPFIVEIRCKNVAAYEKGLTTTVEDQSCVHGLLRCVQRYSEVQTVRRRVDSPSWHPYLLRSVPTGCNCMWPVDKYGHQEL